MVELRQEDEYVRDCTHGESKEVREVGEGRRRKVKQ